MNGPIRLELGKRYNLVLTVEHASHYQAVILHETEITKWRYQFIEPSGRRFVYTGVHIFALKEGETFRLRATVKNTADHGFIRLARLGEITPYFESQDLFD